LTYGLAELWANNLDVYGVTGWRLPTVSPVNGTDFQYDPSDFSNDGSTDFGYAETGVGWGLASEFGHLYYVTLGMQAVSGPFNTGPFTDLTSGAYWEAFGCCNPGGIEAFTFDMGAGAQSYTYVTDFRFAMAVHPGDVATPVSEPQTLGLTLLALAAAVVVRNRKSQPL
jgi:hypothetical protein